MAVRSAKELARTMESALRCRADPTRRDATAGYFPTAMEILGVSAPMIREVIREHRPDWKGLSPDQVVDLVRELNAGGTHEGRQAGYLVLESRKDAHPLLDREALEVLGRDNDNWASVDTFATRVAGPAWREGGIGDATVREWAASEDVWWRRTAVVCTVALNTKARGGTGDAGRTLKICARLAADPEDMVVKGLSWALRSLVAHDPDAVRRFVAGHEPVLAARVKREVARKLETGRKGG